MWTQALEPEHQKTHALQVLTYGVACDGVQLGKKYTVNMYLVRCRDAPSHVAVQTSNVHLLMLVPGPRDPPHGFAAHTNCILHLFHAYGPNSGRCPEATIALYVIGNSFSAAQF